MIDRNAVYSAINDEMYYQEKKYGKDKEQGLAGYLLIMQNELEEAIKGWNKGVTEGRDSPLAEIVQVADVAIKCLETYGVVENTLSTNDKI